MPTGDISDIRLNHISIPLSVLLTASPQAPLRRNSSDTTVTVATRERYHDDQYLRVTGHTTRPSRLPVDAPKPLAQFL